MKNQSIFDISFLKKEWSFDIKTNISTVFGAAENTKIYYRDTKRLNESSSFNGTRTGEQWPIMGS